jgi:hypothetical protein
MCLFALTILLKVVRLPSREFPEPLVYLRWSLFNSFSLELVEDLASLEAFLEVQQPKMTAQKP